LLPELNGTKHLAYAFGVDYYGIRVFIGLFRNKLARKLATARADLTFQITNTCFTSVVTNDFENSLVSEVKLFELETITFGLFWHEVTFCDLKFLAFRVPRKPKYFETILKRRRNRVQHVRSGDKEDLR